MTETKSQQSVAVLIVDDDPIASNMLQHVLSRKFPAADFHATFDSGTALTMIEETLPDILITDFLMPHVDGSQLARKLKAVKPGAKVIMLSGFNEIQIADLEGATESAVDFRLLKPIDFELLLSAMEKCLAASLPS